MKRIFITVSLILLSVAAMAQITDNSVLLVVEKDTTTRGEFKKLYDKNAQQTNGFASKQSIEEYLQLYLNFRLKVQDAISAGYDTNDVVQRELNTYRVQAAEPYMIDQKMKDALIAEAYSHMQYDVRARHILLSVLPEASAADTLAAYKKAMDIRDKIIKGADFAKMAYEYSDDKPAIPRRSKKAKTFTGREGDLGYFTAFGMAYPFEAAVYGLKKGELSNPVRTKYGYHIIQLMDKQPALGKVNMANVVVMETAADSTQGAKDAVKDKIDEAYDLLQKGGSFENVAKRYSEDASAARGGYVQEFTVDRMFPDIIAALYNLKIDEYSKPIHTSFGWFIVKLLSKSGVGSLESALPDIEYRINRDRELRAVMPLKSFAEKLWSDNNLKENPSVLTQFKAIVTDSILKGRWKFDSTQSIYKKALFTYANVNVPLSEFGKFIVENQKAIRSTKDKEVDRLYESFKITHSFHDEIFKLDLKYPEFKALMREYKDGVYLFDVMNEKVWAKASIDTVGLEKFFENNKRNYKWSKEAEATIISYDVQNISTEKVKKVLTKAYSAGVTRKEELQAFFAKKIGDGMVLIEEGKFPVGANSLLDKVEWKEGLSGDIISGETTKGFAIIHSIIPEKQKELNEIRGVVITDYQAFLDAAWIKELRAKYSITINNDVLKSLGK